MESLNDNIEKREEISIKEIFFVIKSNFKKLLISVFVFVFLATLYLITVRPVFTTSSSIIIESNDSSMTSIFDMGLGSDMNYLENEIQVLSSRSTAERAILTLLNSSFKDSLYLFNSRVYKDDFLRKIFRKILFLDDKEQSISNFKSEISDSLFNIYVKKLRKNISVSNLRNTDVLKVQYTSDDPGEAALIINTLIEVYKKRDQEWASGEMRYLKHFLESQLTIKEKDENVLAKIKLHLKNSIEH